jgi:hypothetical protein
MDTDLLHFNAGPDPSFHVNGLQTFQGFIKSVLGPQRLHC